MALGASEVSVTRRASFCAAHYYWRDDWDEHQNRTIFGKCSNRQGHGHNYTLALTVTGPLDPKTGMVINLRQLKQMLKTHVIEVLDHRHLNHEVFQLDPEFTHKNPTLEHLAQFIWQRLEKVLQADPQPWRPSHLVVTENEDLFVEMFDVDIFEQPVLVT
ncbi:MAG: 6-carboxytetrahydropterin synthase [Vampirovibrionales bacterium]|nr:6-carboxytetrahydropterin synthase [Vampirovibrionales bacterium]